MHQKIEVDTVQSVVVLHDCPGWERSRGLHIAVGLLSDAARLSNCFLTYPRYDARCIQADRTRDLAHICISG